MIDMLTTKYSDIGTGFPLSSLLETSIQKGDRHYRQRRKAFAHAGLVVWGGGEGLTLRN